MSIASLLSIKVTSPITHMISSAVRGVAGSLLAMKLFKEIITALVHGFPLFLFFKMTPLRSGRASSIAIILLGSILYTWVKHRETQPSKRDDSPKEVNEDIELGEKRHPK